LGIGERVNDTLTPSVSATSKRVQLAAALVHDPDVLVLDEPFSGLDPLAVDVMSEVLAEKAAHGVPVIFSSHQLDLVERLCHRVGIVVRGHMKECGTVDELRAGGGTQLMVHAPQASPGWADGLQGVHNARYGEGRTVLTLEAGKENVVDQAVLAAALRTGPVHEFSRSQPSLAELFREVVAG
jgi:ABC-2 type transport system ATP-binding protein